MSGVARRGRPSPVVVVGDVVYPPSRRGGFTLVEVLVAIAVAALALTTGLAALSLARERTRAADEALVATLEAAAARDLLIEWLTGAVQTMPGMGGERFEGIAAGIDGDPNPVLILPTRAPTPLGTPYTLVRLYIDLDPATPESGLVAELSEGLASTLDESSANERAAPGVVRRSTGAGSVSLGSVVQRVELAPGATGMTILYLPRTPGATEWLGEWPQSPELPRAVVIYIHGDDPEAVPPLLRHPIRVRLS